MEGSMITGLDARSVCTGGTGMVVVWYVGVRAGLGSRMESGLLGRTEDGRQRKESEDKRNKRKIFAS